MATQIQVLIIFTFLKTEFWETLHFSEQQHRNIFTAVVPVYAILYISFLQKSNDFSVKYQKKSFFAGYQGNFRQKRVPLPYSAIIKLRRLYLFHACIFRTWQYILRDISFIDPNFIKENTHENFFDENVQSAFIHNYRLLLQLHSRRRYGKECTPH
jgi:hypothetical protein